LHSKKKCSVVQSLVPLQLALHLPKGGCVCQESRVLSVSFCVWNLDTLNLPIGHKNPWSTKTFSQICAETRIWWKPNQQSTEFQYHQQENCNRDHFHFTFSILWSHHWEGSEKNSSQSFSATTFGPAMNHNSRGWKSTNSQGTFC